MGRPLDWPGDCGAAGSVKRERLVHCVHVYYYSCIPYLQYLVEELRKLLLQMLSGAFKLLLHHHGNHLGGGGWERGEVCMYEYTVFKSSQDEYST